MGDDRTRALLDRLELRELVDNQAGERLSAAGAARLAGEPPAW